MKNYRIHIQLPGKPDDLRTESFVWKADAIRWARGYASGRQTVCKVKVIDDRNDVAACFLGDGLGKVRAITPGEW